MAKNDTTPMRDLEGFDALIAKRREAVGGSGKTFTMPGFGRDWELMAPELASAAWNDRFTELQQDVRDDAISTSDFRTEFCELILGDQAADFMDACDAAMDGEGIDPIDLLTWAMSEHREKVQENPTRSSSRNNRPRAKRR